MKLIYTGDFDKLKEFRKTLKENKIIEKQNKLIELNKDLLYIQNLVDEALKDKWTLFNVSTADNVGLAYKIFKKGRQYTFGAEPWHWHHIYISKLGLLKLERMIKKTRKKLIKAGLVKKEEEDE